MISTTSEHFSESKSRSGSEGYWSWDPESFTVALSRTNSLQDMVEKMDVSRITPALQSPTVSMSRCSTIKANPQSRPTHIMTPICGSLHSPTPPRSHYRTSDTSFCDDSTLESTSHASDAFISTSISTSKLNTPVPLGLGIFGLTNKNGAPFDGTGIVGLSRNGFSEDNNGDSVKNTGNRHVSFALLDEVSLTFSSSPLPNPALQRVLSTRFSTPTLAARTPTPYPHDFMESADGEYFPIQNVRLFSPLHRVVATRTLAARMPTPYPHDFMEAADGEYFPTQNVELCMSPLQQPFLQRMLASRVSTLTLAARTPTPYPHDSMEAPGGEYFPRQNARPGIGLGIFGLARSDGESFDGTGVVGLQAIAGNVQQPRVSSALIEEIAHTFLFAPRP